MSEEQQPLSQPLEDTAAVAESTTTDSSFISSLPEELRSDPSLADFKDISGLAKSYISSQKMLGNSIRIPGEDASDEARQDFYSKLQTVDGVTKMPNTDNVEEVNSFYKRLGKPETAEEYSLQSLQDQEMNPEVVGQFKDLAYNLNLTNEQANKLAEFELQKGQAQAAQLEESMGKSSEALKEKWGPDYDNRLEGAKAALSMYEEQFPDAVAELKNGALGNNPAIISMLSELYGALKETGAPVPQSTAGNYGMSSEEAGAQIGEIMSNSSHAYWNDSDPSHKDAVQKMKKLNNIVYGD